MCGWGGGGGRERGINGDYAVKSILVNSKPL